MSYGRKNGGVDLFQWFKYTIFAFVLAAVIVAAGFIYNLQNGSVASVQEIETTIATSMMGKIRANEGTEVTKKELVTGVITKTIATQKSYHKNLQIDFVFLDKDGHKTNDESSIRSVQIRTALLNDKGEAQTQAVKRISLNQK